MNPAALVRLCQRIGLDTNDAVNLGRSERIAQALEARWKRKFELEVIRQRDRALEQLITQGRVDERDFDFLPLILDHAYFVSRAGILSTEEPRPRVTGKLAAPRKPPRSLKELFEQWKQHRTGKKVPVREQKRADTFKKLFLDSIAKVWEKHSRDFRNGKAFNLDKARKAFTEKGKVVESYARQVVATETTTYYNQARKRIWDDAEDITHYLFIAVRDKRTTKWCKTRQGLVYAKNDPLCKKETPAIHWHCRSEMVPLTPRNPKHLILIQDKTRARRHNTCEPLPKGWGRAA